MAELVAITYGKALYDVALELNKIDEFLDEVDFIKAVFEMENDFYSLFTSPLVNKGDKKKVIEDVFTGKISSEVLNFLYIILDKKRTLDFNEISDEYTKLAYKHKNMVKGTVYSAVSLKEEQIESLQKKLSDITKKTVKLDIVIDRALIGGIKVKIEDRVIDYSVQNKIKEMKEIIDNIVV